MKKSYLIYISILVLSFSACEKGEIGPQGIQGEKGATGVQGTKGDTGQNGTNGAAGQNGATGAQGEKGDTGAIGAAGQQGPKGETVYNGTQGPKGDTGATGATGTTGATGAQGPKGDTGAQGPAGANGAFSTTYLNTKFSSSPIDLMSTFEGTDLNGNPATYIRLQGILTITPANYSSIAEKGLVLIYVRSTTDTEGIWKLQSSGDILFNASGGVTTNMNDYDASLNFEAYAAKSYVKIVATIQGYLNQGSMENMLRNTGVDIKVVMVPERTATSIKANGVNLKNFSAVAQSLNIR